MCEEAYKTSVICVDNYENSILTGRIMNSYYGSDILFRSSVEFLKAIEALMQELNFPQPYSENRIFNPDMDQKPLPIVKDEGISKLGRLATFTLRIMFRRNSSWQGILFWKEKEQELYFRSVLELLLMIDNAVAA